MSKQEKKILAQKIALSVVIGTLMSSGIAMAADQTGSVTINDGTSGDAYGCVAIDYDNVKNSTLTINGGQIVADGLYGGQAEHGNATGNKVIINGGTFDPVDSELSINIYGGYIEEGVQQDSTVSTASGNSVTVNGGMFKSGETRLRETNVFGGYIVDGVGVATGNTVTIGSAEGGQITSDDRFDEIRGGSACGAEARGNVVTIYDGSIYGVDGGFSYQGGNVVGNTANIYGGTIDYVMGGEARDGGDAINNEVVINGGVVGSAYGGAAYDGGDAVGNTVTVNDGDIYAVDGGYAISGGSAIGNKIIVNGGTVKWIMGGETRGVGDATDNEVIISGGVIKNVYGGVAYDDGDATGNKVIVSGGTVDNVFGGTAANGNSANGNTVIVTDGTFERVYDEENNRYDAASIYGGYSYEGNGNAIGNTVTIGSKEDNKITDADYFEYVCGGINENKGEVKDNTVTIYGGNINLVEGGYTYSGNVTNNTVNIIDGNIDSACGGYVEEGNLIDNTVNIHGGVFTDADIFGGYTKNGTVQGNVVSVDGAVFNGEIDIYGGDVSNGDAKNNAVVIQEGDFAADSTLWVAGGAVLNGMTQGNMITVTGGNFNGLVDLRGGCVWRNGFGDAKNNVVTVRGGLFDTDGSIKFCGGYVGTGTAENNAVMVTDGIFNGDTTVYGGNVLDGDGKNNTITIQGGTFNGDMRAYGSYIYDEGDAKNNIISIQGGTFTTDGVSYFYGGRVESGTAEGNIVSITDGSFGGITNVYGGYIRSGKGDVIGNTVTIGSAVDNKITDEDSFQFVVGGCSKAGSAENNSVTIYGGNYGASNYSQIDGGNGEGKGVYATGNSVAIHGGTFGASDSDNCVNITGGYADTKVTENTVTITDGVFNRDENGYGAAAVYGGFGGLSEGLIDVSQNKVTIGSAVNNKITTDDVFYSVYGGYAKSDAILSGNEVTLYGGVVNACIAGGMVNTVSYQNSKAYNNTVNIYGGDFAESYLFGGVIYDYTQADKDARLTGLYGGKDAPNTLNLGLQDKAYSGAVGNIGGFDVINFNSLDWSTTAAITTEALQLNPTDGTQVTVGTIYAAGEYKIAEQDAMTLISSTKNITGDLRDTSVETTVYDGIAKVYQDVKGTITKNDNAIDLTIDNLGSATRNNQILALGRSRAAATAFVNQGDELVGLSMDSLRRTETDGDLQVFAAVQGSNTDYDIAGNIDVNGWNGIVGIAKKKANGISYGVFFETGDGDYNIDNPYANVRGDGEAEYNGGGIFVRKDNKSGFYTEGALRIGNLSNRLEHAVRNGSEYIGYDIDTLYYGAQIGIGKIIPVGKNDLDVYGKLLYTHHDSERFNMGGTDVRFDSVDSQRLRLGARMNHERSDKFSLYYGASWEYEFDGDADGRADIFGIGNQSFGGSTLIGEIGMNCRASDKWTVDLNFRGYGGQREGISGTLHLNCAF